MSQDFDSVCNDCDAEGWNTVCAECGQIWQRPGEWTQNCGPEIHGIITEEARCRTCNGHGKAPSLRHPRSTLSKETTNDPQPAAEDLYHLTDAALDALIFEGEYEHEESP